MAGVIHPDGAVVLLSGGMDSTVLLHHVARELERAPIHALSYNYGQRHSRELECARTQATLAGVAHHEIIDVSFIRSIVSGGTSLVEGSAEVPDLEDVAEADRDQPPTYVPNRNMMLLSMAAAYAEAHGFADVYYGAQAHDEYGYWDCTVQFLESVNAVLALNRKDRVYIYAPFVKTSKADLVRKGTELAVDFAETWSCYRGGERPCGTCPTCVERANAFQHAGVNDPLIRAV